MHANTPEQAQNIKTSSLETLPALFLCPAVPIATDFSLLEPTLQSTAPWHQGSTHSELQDLIKILMIKTTKKLKHKQSH